MEKSNQKITSYSIMNVILVFSFLFVVFRNALFKNGSTIVITLILLRLGFEFFERYISKTTIEQAIYTVETIRKSFLLMFVGILFVYLNLGSSPYLNYLFDGFLILGIIEGIFVSIVFLFYEHEIKESSKLEKSYNLSDVDASTNFKETLDKKTLQEIRLGAEISLFLSFVKISLLIKLVQIVLNFT